MLSKSSPWIGVAALTVGSATLGWCWIVRLRRTQQRSQMNDIAIVSAYEALIGNTPLVKLSTLSRLVGRSVYVKMESLNPGGTGKDRAALGMIRAAEASGYLPKGGNGTKSTGNSAPVERESSDPFDSIISKAMRRSKTGGLVVEGTSGSTGIALASLCQRRGHACVVVLPDDQASEKQRILEALGAETYVVSNAAIANPNHYVNVARRLAVRANELGTVRAVFIDQFENVSNFDTHYEQTGPELWRQCKNLDAFVMSSGTGGTIAGIGRFLKEKHVSVKVVLVDPPGSALYHKIQHGVAFANQQRERELKRHRYDTLAEGIGLDRVTNNLALGVDCIDLAIRVMDQEAVDMAHWLLANEGLWVGSSSAMNVVGAVRVALQLPSKSTIVTIICDAGQRHVTRFWNRDFILSRGLEWPGDCERIPGCIQNIEGSAAL